MINPGRNVFETACIIYKDHQQHGNSPKNINRVQSFWKLYHAGETVFK
jgi:hypothetical protein